LEEFELFPDLGDLVALGLTILFRLEIEENGDTWPGEDVVVAFDPFFPPGGLQEVNHGAESMGVILCGIEERGLDFIQIGHASKQERINKYARIIPA
jgi:hypothetical protein